jgi:hypothetical protein
MTRPAIPCHCLCTVAHPGEPGICQASRAVTSRRYDSELVGPVDVPLCGPCAAAHDQRGNPDNGARLKSSAPKGAGE